VALAFRDVPARAATESSAHISSFQCTGDPAFDTITIDTMISRRSGSVALHPWFSQSGAADELILARSTR